MHISLAKRIGFMIFCCILLIFWVCHWNPGRGVQPNVYSMFFFLKHHTFFLKVQRSPTKTGEQSMKTPFSKFVNLVSVVICSYLFLLFLFHPEISKKIPVFTTFFPFYPKLFFDPSSIRIKKTYFYPKIFGSHVFAQGTGNISRSANMEPSRSRTATAEQRSKPC